MELVERALEALFPSEDERNSARQALETYGLEDYQGEQQRVCLAVLKLSEGNLAKLNEFVSAAKSDPRDVLMWAEYPGEMKHLGLSLKANGGDEAAKEKIAEVRRADREQYEQWLSRFSRRSGD